MRDGSASERAVATVVRTVEKASQKRRETSSYRQLQKSPKQDRMERPSAKHSDDAATGTAWRCRKSCKF